MKQIYLDHAASTPCDPQVAEAMVPFWTTHFGNPHSSDHAHGWLAAEAVHKARGEVAALIGARTEEIIFTSGATEANHLAILGAARALKGKKRHIITLQSEHSCVLGACKILQREGFDVTYLQVDRDGRINLEDIKVAVRAETALVSVMMLNNETGVLQPVGEIARWAQEAGILFHCDAAQAVGKMQVNVKDIPAAMISLSAHKMYGPKGIGALYLRSNPVVPIQPLFEGGGQEKGLRAGTLPVPLCAGFGKACTLAASRLEADHRHIQVLAETFLKALDDAGVSYQLNGHRDQRWPGILSLYFPGVTAEALLASLKGVSLSTGAACSSGQSGPSHVLHAMGLSDEIAANSLRVSFGRVNTIEETRDAARRFIGILAEKKP